MPSVLSIETSSNIGAVCVLRDGVAVNEIVRDEAKLSAWVLPAIDRAMTRAAMSFEQIDAVAFGSGPGAFTGVRTACATAQAIAYARKKPLYAINSLEALAFFLIRAPASNAQFNRAKREISVIIDARMNELFAQNFYGQLPQKLEAISEPVVSSLHTHSLRDDHSSLGSGALLLAERMKLDEQRIASILSLTSQAEDAWAESMAHIALNRFKNGDRGVDPLGAQPTYVRNNVAKTEAERAAEAHMKTLAFTNAKVIA
ncbi:MAG: tRNA (adenosine(37)-N6)-threonylcarbamoyltransferase complex dimerization subunit type 1 TsaB [Casimicrobium sp.]